ncbi:MFS transporter [Tropicimonas sediminicola]|uniref:Predicted arabinose efflux permease, MFS family n=1 Tax=Tropicimonas sediminicola TaxID=1031541 RepID=A0A239GZX8_9RHOB|nr:MFS transporter [Tropicimonas sediminicola]SNS74348.1 Predicted arabinose efflux permease, MFS family [Tropicimonas sediminicola]
MTDAAQSIQPDSRARRNVWILVAAQAILGSQLPMIYTIAGLAGSMLAPNVCLATLPVSMIVIGSMTTAPWLSSAMQMLGRRAGFFIGVFGGILGAAVSARGLWVGSFPLFLLGSYLTGIYVSAQGFYRFAAADTASDDFRPKAISYVMAGGLVSAMIGPTLGTSLADAYVVPFLGTYLGAIAINIVGMSLFFLLDIPKPPRPEAGAPRGRSRLELLRDPTVLVAMICGMTTYALMNLVMTSTPLAVVGCGFETETAGYVVTAHVLAMFIPSFFTGHLISRFGVRTVISAGLVILAGGGVVALSGVELEQFFLALILLGLGWNFGFIGATTMLSQAHAPEERGRVQGMNDTLVFGCVALASLVSGGLMNCTGGDAQQGWMSVNLAMAPFLALAGGALIWLALRPED